MIGAWLLGAGALTAVVVFAFSGAGTPSAPTDPDLVAAGATVYATECAACHGADLRGTGSGPPFLDPTYAPNHHSDAAFFLAVRQGVQPHHWDFGPMPPRPSLTDDDIAAVVAYIRSKQIEAGITFDPRHG